MKYDHVIIGGGLYGCATAKHLADAGKSVVVLEAGDVASGASGGFGKRGVRANRRDIRELPLARRAYEMWPDLAQTLDADVGYERTGGVYLIEKETSGSRGGRIAAPAQANMQTALGVPTEYLDKTAVQELLPGVSETVQGGLYCAKDGMADQQATTHAYRRSAEAAGAEIREHTSVVRIHAPGGTATSVECERGDHFDIGDSVLVSNNYHAADLVHRSFGFELPMWPLFPQALLLEPKHHNPVTMLVGHDHRPLSLKTLPDGLVMASGGWRGKWNPERTGGELVPENVIGNLTETETVFPALAGSEIVGSDASRPEACTADQIPIIDVLPGARNTFVATGWTGHGFAIAPAVAVALSQWMNTGVKDPVFDPFTLNRFTMN